MSSGVMRRPSRTSQRTSVDEAFIRNAKSFYQTFPILTFPLSSIVGVGSHCVASRSLVPLCFFLIIIIQNKNWKNVHFDSKQYHNDMPYKRDVKSAVSYHFYLNSKGYRALIYRFDNSLLSTNDIKQDKSKWNVLTRNPIVDQISKFVHCWWMASMVDRWSSWRVDLSYGCTNVCYNVEFFCKLWLFGFLCRFTRGYSNQLTFATVKARVLFNHKCFAKWKWVEL